MTRPLPFGFDFFATIGQSATHVAPHVFRGASYGIGFAVCAAVVLLVAGLIGA